MSRTTSLNADPHTPLRLTIPRWHPTPLNKLLKCHFATANKFKRIDRNMIMAYCMHNRLPIATGPRRVDLLITLAYRQRGCDPDSVWKSTLDGLVHAKMLI